MPLVHGAQEEIEPPTAAEERARKINPELSRGQLVRIAGSRNQAEAELIQGILLEEGIPSMQRRTRGFDVPDFLAAGPRDILVPESGAESARELLGEAEVESAAGTSPEAIARGGAPSPVKLMAWILVALLIGSAFFGLLWAAGG